MSEMGNLHTILAKEPKRKISETSTDLNILLK